jgi:glycosyltransferase involved in cell wall biosynthesis
VEEKRNLLGLSDFKGVVFGVAALLVPRKGHHVLIEAVMKLINKNKFLRGKFKILIAGSGPMKQSLVDFIEINNLNDCINFVGFQENIGEFMSVIDVLILPSIRDEDFPYVILEAMSKGKPVIASHLAGTPEQVVQNVTGILVKPCNLHELENAIFKLINDSILRIDMGRAALERYENNFTDKIALDNYISLYKELAKND